MSFSEKDLGVVFFKRLWHHFQSPPNHGDSAPLTGDHKAKLTQHQKERVVGRSGKFLGG